MPCSVGRFRAGRSERLGKQLHERIVAGGFPPAIARQPDRRRASWYRDYAEAHVQRDVQDLARIKGLDVLPDLLNAAASQTARLYNLTDLSSPFQQSRQTIGDYVTLLERVFLIERLRPWHSNRLNRLVKTPKLHIGDTGLGCAVLGLDERGLATNRDVLGQMLETFVYQELRRQASWNPKPSLVLPLSGQGPGRGGRSNRTGSECRCWRGGESGSYGETLGLQRTT